MKSGPVRHGTEWAYRRHRCRCEPCLDNQRERQRNRRRAERLQAKLWALGQKSRSPVVDEIAVQRAKHGDRVRLTVPERTIVVAELTRAGVYASEIAERLGVTRRTVQRYRTKLRGAA